MSHPAYKPPPAFCTKAKVAKGGAHLWDTTVVGNFDGAKFCRNASRLLIRNFRDFFIFMEQTCDAQTTPLPVDCHTTHTNQAT